MIPVECIHALGLLVSKMEGTPAIDDATVERLQYQFQETSKALIREGVDYSKIYHPLPHLRRPDAQDYIKSIRNDLCAQVEITDRMFDDWVALGEYPAPGYPERICVILRKAKLFELEFDFLRCFCLHFQYELGSGAKLIERARKIGAYTD